MITKERAKEHYGGKTNPIMESFEKSLDQLILKHFDGKCAEFGERYVPEHTKLTKAEREKILEKYREVGWNCYQMNWAICAGDSVITYYFKLEKELK